MSEAVIRHERSTRRRLRTLDLDAILRLNAYPRSPLLALRRYRYFLKEQYDLVAEVDGFRPLLELMVQLDRWVLGFELEFLRYVENEIGDRELRAYIDEEFSESEISDTTVVLMRDVEEGGFFYDAAEDLAQRIWEKTTAHIPYLGDAIRSAHEDATLFRAGWQVRFEDDRRKATVDVGGGEQC